MVETFLFLPSRESSDSESILISPSSNALVLFKIICATVTAELMLKPLALSVMDGNIDS